MSEFFAKLYYLIRHLNDNAAWSDLLNHIGMPAVYVTLFAIIFLETGVVIFPFLPGDSLLFAVGAISARPEVGLGFWTLFVLLLIAAIIGDALNYFIGKTVGPSIFSRPVPPKGERRLTDRLLNRDHLLKAQAFYEKHGGKTIILARFVPIIRTFAPFVAGIGRMSYARFALYNVVGAIAWVGICMAAGRFFGEFKFVKERFELVVLMIIFISVLPVIVEFWRARKAEKTGGDAILEATTIGEKVD